MAWCGASASTWTATTSRPCSAEVEPAMATLTGKSIIVTGAAGAIGGATAKVLAREGARLVLVDVQAEGLAARERELKAAGAEVISQRADVSRGVEVKAFIDAAVARFGRVDGLFNNAGIEGHIAN